MTWSELVNEVRETATCRKFAEYIGLRINRAGFCCCPFHNERTPSLKIYDESNSWYCFGCHRGGDVFAMASIYYGTGFSDTVRTLALAFGINKQERAESRPDSLRIAVERAKGKISRQREERERERIEAEYWNAYDRYLEIERIIRDKAPKTPFEDFCEEFVMAVAERAVAKEILEYATERRQSLYGKK